MTSTSTRVGTDKVGPSDPRYADLVRRGFNKRFAGTPDYVRLVGSTEQVVEAVQEAVRDELRVVVRSAGVTASRASWRTRRCGCSSTPR